MAIPAITPHSPSTGHITWAAFTIQYGGVSYGIPTGSTNLRWVWWRYNGGGANSIIDAGADVPADLADDDLVLFGNKNGIPIRVQSTSFVDGELVVDGSILAAAIGANQIVTSHMQAGTINADRLTVNTLTGDRIMANTIMGDRIMANTITASKVAISDFTNYVADGTFLYGKQNWPNGSGTIVADDPNYYRIVSVSNSNVDNYQAARIEVKEGESYWVSYEVMAEVGNTTWNAVNLHFGTRNAAGTTIGWPSHAISAAILQAAGAGVWVPTGGAVSMVAGGVDALIGLAISMNGTTGNAYRFRNVVVRRRSGGELIVDGAITTAKMTANTISGTVITANTLNADKIVAGSISGDRIAANTISTGKLLISDSTNLLDNPQLKANGAGWTPGWWSLATTVGGPGLAWTTTGTSQSKPLTNDALISVEPGSQFWLGVRAQNNTDISAALIALWYDKAGTYISESQAAVLPISFGGWENYGGSVTAPTTAYQMKYRISVWSTATTGSIWATQFTVRRRSAGELIVDGGITANQLAAGAVTANKLNVIMGGGNLMSNSGFQNATNFLTGWIGNNVTTTTATSSNVQKFHDTLSLKAVNTTAGQDSYYSQTVTGIQPSTTYSISAWLYVEAITGVAGSSRAMLVYDGTAIGTDATLTTSHVIGKWTRKVVTLTTSATATYIQCRLYVPQGTVYWDAVQMEVGDVATAYSPRSDEILPGTIVTNMLQATAINGMTITGATVQSENTPARGVKMTSTGLIGYDGTGAQKFNLTSAGALTVAGTVTAGGTIDGAIVTGGTLQSEPAASRGVKINSSGLTAYNATGTPTFTVTASTGAVSLLGTLQAGSVITTPTLTGGTLQTQTEASRGVKITSAGLQVFNTSGTPMLTATTAGVVSISGTLTASTFDSGTVTGGTVQSQAEASRGIKMNSSGLTAYNATGTPTLTITASTGAISMLGTLQSGSVITSPVMTGGTLQTQTEASRGVKITSAGLQVFNASGVSMLSATTAGVVAITGALTSSTFSSGTVTGGTVQTQIEASRGVKINSSGITGYNTSGATKFTLSASTGLANIVDGISTGGKITGAVVETITDAGRGIKMDTTSLVAWDSVGNPKFILNASTGVMTATGGNFSGGIDASIITGGTVQSQVDVARGIKMNSSGMTAYDGAGNPTFVLNAATGTVTSMAVQSGAISGTAIAANTITASHLRVTDLTNMVIDPDFKGFGWDFAGGVYVDGAFPDKSSTASGVPVFHGNGVYQTAQSTFMVAKAGEDYALKWDFIATDAPITGNFAIRLAWFTAAGVYLSYTDVWGGANSSIPSAWTTLSGHAVAPKDTGQVRVELIRYNENTHGYIIFDNIKLNKRYGAELLVEGAIFGQKYATNTGFDDIEIVPGDYYTPAALKFKSDGAFYSQTDPATISCYDSAWSVNGQPTTSYTVKLQGGKSVNSGTRPRIDITTHVQNSSSNVVQATLAYHAGGSGGWKGAHHFYIDGDGVATFDHTGMTMPGGAPGIGLGVFASQAGNNGIFALGNIKSSAKIESDTGLFDLSAPYSGWTDLACKWNSNGRVIQVGSSRQFKQDIEPLSLDVARGALGLEAVSFQWRPEMELGDKRVPGFIAEQAAEAGLDLWVTRDLDGQPNGFHYAELTAAHNVLIRDLYDRIEALERRN